MGSDFHSHHLVKVLFEQLYIKDFDSVLLGTRNIVMKVSWPLGA